MFFTFAFHHQSKTDATAKIWVSSRLGADCIGIVLHQKVSGDIQL